MEVSILTTTCNRASNLPLLIYNIKNQYYNKELIEWVIFDNNDVFSDKYTPPILWEIMGKQLKPIKINYHSYSEDLSVSKQWNQLVGFASNKILIHMTEGAYYPPNYITTIVKQLADSNIVGFHKKQYICPNTLEIKISNCLDSCTEKNLNLSTMAYTSDFYNEIGEFTEKNNKLVIETSDLGIFDTTNDLINYLILKEDYQYENHVLSNLKTKVKDNAELFIQSIFGTVKKIQESEIEVEKDPIKRLFSHIFIPKYVKPIFEAQKRFAQNIPLIKQEDPGPNTLPKQISKQKLAIICQLHTTNISTVSGMFKSIEIIYSQDNDVDIYFTIIEKDETKFEKIRTFIEQQEWYTNIKSIDLWKNKGMDVGAFIWKIDQMHKAKILEQYDLVVKIHTKSHHNWRRHLLKIFTEVRMVNQWLDIFQNNPEIGMLGSLPFCLINLPSETPKQDKIEFLPKHCFNREPTENEQQFVGGTMFVVRSQILIDLLEKLGEDMVQTIYDTDPEGRFFDNADEDHWAHSMERFFGYFTLMNNSKLYGIYPFDDTF